MIPHAEDIAVFDVDPELSWVLIVEKEVSIDVYVWWYFLSTGPFYTGSIPNTVHLGIYEAARNRQRSHFDGAAKYACV